ncbi:exopolysaccharide biosynthesis protein [Erythrobacter sp. HKB08]|uniref:exopolysaccharide biosynthesis protein n=1 Tax=Erythrobacter sp. HKB08 TaxID=2502843 RepID=UPI001008F1EA|nr:exopolysaccharide biosynthesis protein [Erythrobacter sp. HKB08]
MSKDPQNLEDMIEGVEHLAEEKEKVSLGDALDEFGSRSYGPFLVLLPLLEFSPLGGIPGVPTGLAVLIALIAVQILFGKKHIWLPAFVQNRKVKSKKIGAFAERLEGTAEKIDSLFHKRLQSLTHGWPVRAQALIIIALCAMVPPLEVVPFASSAPMMAIAAFGLALLMRDGLLTLIAGALSIGSIYLVFTTVLSGGGGG